MYDYGVEQRLTMINPATMIATKFIGKAVRRKRNLTPRELREFLQLIYWNNIRRQFKPAGGFGKSHRQELGNQLVMSNFAVEQGLGDRHIDLVVAQGGGLCGTSHLTQENTDLWILLAQILEKGWDHLQPGRALKADDDRSDLTVLGTLRGQMGLRKTCGGCGPLLLRKQVRLR